MFEEERSKAVRTWTCGGVHISESRPDFFRFELAIQTSKVLGIIRVQAIQIKIPSGFSRRSQEVQVKRMKDSSFLFMPVDLASIVFQNLYVVSSPALIRTRVKEACIFIALYSSSDFGSLLPEQ